jgi:hypothetical protein
MTLGSANGAQTCPAAPGIPLAFPGQAGLRLRGNAAFWNGR